jgi:hypothetical protein
MPLSHIHVAFNLSLYYLASLLVNIEFLILNIFLLISAELIDLDHLFSRPIYKKNRNSFKHHFFHKNYKFVLLFSLLISPFYPLSFLGLGLTSHLTLDYLYVKYFLKK